MSNNQGKYTNMLSPNIIDQVVRGLTELVETTLWGNASEQKIAAVDDIKNWFREIPDFQKKKILLGAVLRIETASGVRIYQGVFDKKMNCFLARQLLVEELSKDLDDFFGHEKVVILIEDKKLIEQYIH